MAAQRTFSLAEAHALIPTLKTMLAAANQDLRSKAEALASAYVAYEKAEKEMNKSMPNRTATRDTATDTTDFSVLRQSRLTFQSAIETLAQAKQNYMQALNFWFDEITDNGVILRDIKTGLLDFPARQGNFDYYLCWQGNEDEILYWHMINDGFIGRRPLAVLKEYL